MENEMQNSTETNPVIPPVKHARSLEYAAEIEGFRSIILKAGLSTPNEIIDDGIRLRRNRSYKSNDRSEKVFASLNPVFLHILNDLWF